MSGGVLDNKLFITGGLDNVKYLDSKEYVSLDGSSVPGPSMPVINYSTTLYHST